MRDTLIDDIEVNRTAPINRFASHISWGADLPTNNFEPSLHDEFKVLGRIVEVTSNRPRPTVL